MQTTLTFLGRHGITAPTIGVLDIGAMLMDPEEPPYAPLVAAGAARVLGFEPVASECERLNREQADGRRRFLPYFVGDGTRQTFHLSNASMTSSLYAPDVGLLGLFQNLLELTTTVERSPVQTTRLDDIAEIDFPVDYVKIDIQGAELQAFRHGERVLGNVTVIHTEVEWVPLYRDQPLFAEVEQELRRQGFLLHRILTIGSRTFKPLYMNNDPDVGNQHLWSDVLFVRDFRRLDRLEPRQLLAAAIVAADIYRAPDLACLLLAEYGRRSGQPLGDEYRNWIATPR